MKSTLALILGITLFSFVGNAGAQSIEELRSKISNKSAEIEALEKEIAGYQKELETIGGQKQTLQSEIKLIDITRKKIAADIKVTENKITSSNLTIERLRLDIGAKSEDIAQNIEAIKEILRNMQQVEDRSLVELTLSSRNISDFWGDVEEYTQFQKKITDMVNELEDAKTKLETNKAQIEKERAELVRLKATLSDQKRIADNNRAERDKLLKQTQNKESEYQKIVAEKTRLRDEFERDLLNYESELRIAIDPSLLPPTGKGILVWPVDNVFITQKFGNTLFAKGGAYNGQGHNGVDFRASIGTEVKSALSGVVVGAGNSDEIRGCYSYGKWILVQHSNGLSTLYAHLSLIKVTKGESVGTRQVIGYSGNTGYTTGPHLHFGVYATQGVKVVRFGDVKKGTNCANATLPVASFNAYLDPLLYL